MTFIRGTYKENKLSFAQEQICVHFEVFSEKIEFLGWVFGENWIFVEISLKFRDFFLEFWPQTVKNLPACQWMFTISRDKLSQCLLYQERFMK